MRSSTLGHPWTLVLCLAALILPATVMAQPLATVDVMFSTDDGVTFFDLATVDETDEFLLRIYFDNTGDEPGTGASVALTLPAGFTRVGSSTRVCHEPTDGEIVCSEDVGQSGAIDEAGVWAGQDLTISPTAGLYGESTGQTTGLLEIGKAAFLNLHDCHYFNGVERFFVTADPDISGTNVSNTADAAAACAGVVGAYGNAGQELRTAGLLAQRYLNFHQCHYNFLTDHIYKIADGTATRTSNDVDATFNCAGTAGAHILHPDSDVVNFDLFGNRYLNLWECRYISGGDLISINTSGSNTSSTPDVGPSCPATLGAYTFNDSDLLVLDTLDASRGRGFVEVRLEAATTGGGDFDFNAALSTNELATENDTGTLTVIGTSIPAPNPSVDLRFSQDCGNTFIDQATPFMGESFITRIYFDNTGDLPGTGTQITTTLPNGFDRVPDTTRVCLSPTEGEVVCNTDTGQGGTIDEAVVWTGDTLTIAPSAGVAGELPDATTGLLDIGRKRYLNSHECHYFDGFSDRLFLTDSATTGTNVSNTMDTMATCQPVAHSRNLVAGVVTAHDLLGQRYFNIHECQYEFFLVDRIFLQGTGASGTTASNEASPSLACQPNAGAHSLLAAESNLLNLDLAGQRYLNQHECVMISGLDHIGLVASPAGGTNASDTEDTLAQCPTTSGAHSLVAGSVSALDLLDQTRGRGFVEYWVTATETLADEMQTATLSGAEFMDQTDNGTLQATTGKLFANGFECGTLDAWDAVVP